MILILLVVLILLAFGGGFYSPAYRTPGLGLGTVLVILLIVWIIWGQHGRVF